VKLLLVDDQESIRETVKGLLKHLIGDIKIDEASDGDKAFKIYRRKRGRYDLVLTDIDHPGLDGFDLAKAILKKNPAQALAFVTASGVAGKIVPLGSLAPKLQPIPLELNDILVLGMPYEYKQLLALIHTAVKMAHR